MEKISSWIEKTENRKLIIGEMAIREGMQDGRIWIENGEGEGGDFPPEDIEKLLLEYFNKHF